MWNAEARAMKPRMTVMGWAMGDEQRQREEEDGKYGEDGGAYRIEKGTVTALLLEHYSHKHV